MRAGLRWLFIAYKTISLILALGPFPLRKENKSTQFKKKGESVSIQLHYRLLLLYADNMH